MNGSTQLRKRYMPQAVNQLLRYMSQSAMNCLTFETRNGPHSALNSSKHQVQTYPPNAMEGTGKWELQNVSKIKVDGIHLQRTKGPKAWLYLQTL